MPRLAIALLIAAAATASGQVRSRQGSPSSDNRQGVPAVAPAPISGLGGVRATFPQIQPLGQPLNQPQFKPMPVGPWPGTISTNTTIPASVTPPSSNFLGPPAFSGQPFIVRDHNRIDGVVTSGSGLTVNGSFTDDNFRLRFHIGSDPALLIPHHHHNNGCTPSSPYVYWYPGWWYDGFGYYGYHNRYDTIYGNYSPPDPAVYNTVAPTPPPQTESVRPSTDRELADTYLRAGDPRAAITAYKSHLKQYPGDEDALRALGLALIDSGQTAEGAAIIAAAYRAEPLLAERPLTSAVLRDGDDSLRRDLQRTSVYANRVKSASAWLAVAALMQAEGRHDNARAMLDRAKSAGLEVGVFDRMSAALQ